jgi:hypothetical protein
MGLSSAVEEINQGVRSRYMDGNALELTFHGHHPDFVVEETRTRLNFARLERDSINLIGDYPIRNVVIFGDPLVIYDGRHYYSRDIFASFVSAQTLTRISHELELPHSFSS